MIKLEMYNDKKIRLICGDDDVLNAVENYFSVLIEGHFFNPKVKMGVWDGRLRFFDRRNKTISLGLLEELYNLLSAYDKVEIDDHILGLLKPQKYEFDIELPNIQLYPYQCNAINTLLLYKRGLAKIATGGGKSSLVIALIRALTLARAENNASTKSLIIVPTVHLVSQFYKEFDVVGWKPNVAMLHGEDKSALKNYDSDVVISTWQSLHSLAKKDKKKYKEFIEQFHCVVVDETHQVKAAALSQIMADSTAMFRFGLTATIPSNQADYFTIASNIGPVRVDEGAYSLQQQGYLSKLIIKRVLLKHKPKPKFDDIHSEKKWIVGYEKRNKLIAKLAEKHMASGQNVLVLVEHVEHGKTLSGLITGSDFIHGAIDVDDRETARELMEQTDKNCIVATFGTYSTGVNIKKLHTIILASPGKSEIRTIQSIGRGLRLHESKDHLEVYDIVDNTKFAARHGEARLKIFTIEGFPTKNYEMEI